MNFRVAPANPTKTHPLDQRTKRERERWLLRVVVVLTLLGAVLAVYFETRRTGRHCPGRRGRLSALSVFLCKSVLYGAFVWARRAPNRRKWRFPARAEMVEREKKALAHTSLPALLQAADKVGVPVAEVDIALTDAAPKIALMRGPGPPAGAVKRLSVAHSKSSLYGAFVWARRALNRRKMTVSGPGSDPWRRLVRRPRRSCEPTEGPSRPTRHQERERG